jgi:hypothetical protein
VTFVSDVFVTLGVAEAERLGLADLRYVVVPHPVGHRRADELDDIADGAFDGIVDALTREAS